VNLWKDAFAYTIFPQRGSKHFICGKRNLVVKLLHVLNKRVFCTRGESICTGKNSEREVRYVISFVNVEIVYPDGTRARKSLDMTMYQGEYCVLIGSSGCGKAITLKVISLRM